MVNIRTIYIMPRDDPHLDHKLNIIAKIKINNKLRITVNNSESLCDLDLEVSLGWDLNQGPPE